MDERPWQAVDDFYRALVRGDPSSWAHGLVPEPAFPDVGPDVRRRARKERFYILGIAYDGSILPAQLPSNETQLNASPNICLYETLRLTQHAIGSIRKVRSETGFHITTSDGRRLVVPKGHYVGSAHILIGRQAAFQCPDRFDPDQHFRRDESTRNKTVPLTVGGTSRRHVYSPFSRGCSCLPRKDNR